jgi:hypothetical protein
MLYVVDTRTFDGYAEGFYKRKKRNRPISIDAYKRFNKKSKDKFLANDKNKLIGFKDNITYKGEITITAKQFKKKNDSEKFRFLNPIKQTRPLSKAHKKREIPNKRKVK